MRVRKSNGPMKTNTVRSRFAAPAAIALAAHALFFFGFSSRPPTLPTLTNLVPEPPPRETPPIREVELAPPQHDKTDDTETSEAPRSSPQPTSLPEPPPSVVPEGATTIRPEIPVVSPQKYDGKTIPIGPFGPEKGEGTGNGPHLWKATQLDNAPRVKFQARPVYPFGLRQAGMSGEVLVDFLVDEQGRVSDIRVVRSTHPEFEEPTIRAVSQWKFEPGKRQGRVVRFRMSQQVGFMIGE